MTVIMDNLFGWTVLIHARTVGATGGGKRRADAILSEQKTVSMTSSSDNTEDDNLVSATSSAEVDKQHPGPYLQTRFAFSGKKEKSYRRKCPLCIPKTQEIIMFNNSLLVNHVMLITTSVL